MFGDDRISKHAANVRDHLERGERVDGTGPTDPEAVARLDGELAVSFREHTAYQNLQARAHAKGILTTDEAQVVYRALGDSFTETNGGWAKGTDLALKVTITELVGQLLGAGV